MMLTMLKGKIHRATVKQAEVDYIGSITIDSELMEAAGILEYEKVQVADVNNGRRLETYVIAGEPGSGMICLNGAAAHYVEVGDKVIHDGIDGPGVGAAPGACGVVNGHISAVIDIRKHDKVANVGEIANVHERNNGLAL